MVEQVRVVADVQFACLALVGRVFVEVLDYADLAEFSHFYLPVVVCVSIYSYTNTVVYNCQVLIDNWSES